MEKTLFDKIWDEHVFFNLDESTSVLYIDKHLIHEERVLRHLMV